MVHSNKVMDAIQRHAVALSEEHIDNQVYHLIRIRQLTETAIILEEEKYG